MTSADVTFQDYRLISPDDVQPHPDNPRRGHLAAIVESIRVNGFYGAIVVQASSQRVIAGNHRLLAARELGLEQIPATFVDVDDTTALRILAVDNRANDLAGYDNDALLELLTTLDATDMRLDGTGYTDADLDQLLNPQPPPALTDPDDVPAAPAQPVTKAGDVWLLGPHRLLCGDSLDPEARERVLGGGNPTLVYCDPPYGISIVRGNTVGGGGIYNGKMIKCREYPEVIGDESPEAAAAGFRVSLAAYPRARQVWWGANHYAGTAELPNTSCWLVWDKENGTTKFADAELAWTNHTGAVRLLRHMWNGVHRATERGPRVHPTQKPAALAVWAFEEADRDHPTGLVLDMFGGSGSTLIACHMAGRPAAVIEMDPHYCDVILRRWHEHTGITPTNQDTGQAFTVKSHDAETVKVRA